MQIVPVDGGNCRFVWISDFLPDERAAMVQLLVEEGSAALVKNIQSGEAAD